jgi:hypothetical protein
MKVRISYTIDVTDEQRQAINRYYGEPGLADREAIQNWYRMRGESMNEDLAAYYSDDDDEDSDQ